MHRAHHYIHRARNLRKRVKLLLIGGFFAYIALLSQLYAAWFVYPHTTLAGHDISHMTREDVRRLIDAWSTIPYKLQVQNRQYPYTYPSIGAEFDTQTTLNTIFSVNHEPFPLNTLALAQSLWQSRDVPVSLVFTQRFTQLIDRTIYDFSDTKDTMYFDQQDQSLVYIENDERYVLDESYLKALLVRRVGDNRTPLYPKIVKLANIRADNAADAATRIKQLYLTPLTIMIETAEGKHSFLLTEAELYRIANISLSPDQTTFTIGINPDPFTMILNEHVKQLHVLAKGNIATPKVLEDMADILKTRFNGRDANALTIVIDNGPNTTGSLAEKYIEVDISQQKMYLFRNTKLVKSYPVSTGLEYPTPTGQFTILNKAGLGYSAIYHVWMAWWMGFKYSDELHAYFGIHELPYTLAGVDKIHRPADFIGKPNTGGCVALGIGDAEEVYRFADIGTRVAIYN